MTLIAGTEGYHEEAEALLASWALLDPTESCAPIHDVMTRVSGSALDVGAGDGAVAAHLSALGWTVKAVEPVAGLRRGAQRLHPDRDFTWVDDALPALSSLAGERFDLITCLGVLMHLDARARAEAMATFAGLLSPGGQLALSLRYGLGPKARVYHRAPAFEVIQQARAVGLVCTRCEARESIQAYNRARGVTWVWLVFETS